MGNLARVNNAKGFARDEAHHDYSQLKTHYDKKNKLGWLFMNGSPRPYFTPQLLNDIAHYHHQVQVDMEKSDHTKYDYLIFASDEQHIFSLGRDLELIYQLIKQQNREQLALYAKHSIAPLYQHLTHLSCDLTTVSLVQGDALGGGFEMALSTDLIIAERGSKFGFPEVLFNSFPSMGGFSFLSRKVGTPVAENIILSGQLFTAEALYEIGIIDILAEKGEGELELYKYIKGQHPAAKQQQTIRKVKEACNPISYQELLRVANIWVETTLKTSEKDLRMMNRLITRHSVSLSS
jgi:DSF synthase